MNRQCKLVKDLLLDKAYAGPGEFEEQAVSKSPDVQDGKADRTSSDSLTTHKTRLSEAEIAEHLKGCPECAGYADTLADISRLLRPIEDPVASGSAVDGTATGVKAEDIAPDWARLSATIERGVKMRIARESRMVALFALVAAGILVAVWVPLLAWDPQALLGLQAVGFFGIAIFYLPIHLLREMRGENL
jgi:hypothetical protein